MNYYRQAATAYCSATGRHWLQCVFVCLVLVERLRLQQHQRSSQHVPANIIPVQRCQDHHVHARLTTPCGLIVIITFAYRSTWITATTVVFRVTFSRESWDQQWPAFDRTTATTPTCDRHSKLPSHCPPPSSTTIIVPSPLIPFPKWPIMCPVGR